MANPQISCFDVVFDDKNAIFKAGSTVTGQVELLLTDTLSLKGKFANNSYSNK